MRVSLDNEMIFVDVFRLRKRFLAWTTILRVATSSSSNIPGGPRRPENIPGVPRGNRGVPGTVRPGGVPRAHIPGGISNSIGGQDGSRPVFVSSTNRHLIVTLSVIFLAVIFIFGSFLTPYGELFRATSGKSILIGLVAFFASTVLHAFYTFDEDSSKSDGSFSEWNFIPRRTVEKAFLIGCWIIGIVNLASMMTEIARGLL